MNHCGEKMKLCDMWDDPYADEPVAYNVWMCNECGALCREDVWAGAGRLWIDHGGKVTFEPKPMDPSCP